MFTSPSVDTVLAAIRAVAGSKGVLLIIKNYTGDRLNFGLAAELARAEGIAVDSVVVADDVALRDTVEPTRRRGIAGTVLVHKIAGAAAPPAPIWPRSPPRGRRRNRWPPWAWAWAPAPCRPPAAPAFNWTAERRNWAWAYGEAGVRRVATPSAADLCATLLDAILQDRGWLPGQRVALLVNGLGGTPPMELAIVARAALAHLRLRGLLVERAWSGNFMTALEMPGCSLSLLALDDQRLSWLDQATLAPAWPAPAASLRNASCARRRPAPPKHRRKGQPCPACAAPPWPPPPRWMPPNPCSPNWTRPAAMATWASACNAAPRRSAPCPTRPGARPTSPCARWARPCARR